MVRLMYIEMLSKTHKKLVWSYARDFFFYRGVKWIKEQMTMSVMVKFIYIEMLSKDSTRNIMEWYADRCGIKWVGD